MHICECGKEFDNAQKFNGHKSHCKVHLEAVGKLDDYEHRKASYKNQLLANHKIIINNKKEAFNQKLASWLATNPHCEKCGKVMTEKFGSGRFCSRACANSRKLSDETKAKIHATAARNHKFYTININAEKARLLYNEKPNFCKICGKQLPYELRYRKTCSSECLSETFKAAGICSAQKRVLRSKNEIYFCELCEKYFKNVKHNEPIFNGWDADIIIEDIKYAILWNGPWHYKKITASHCLRQVQNRDAIKLIEIEKSGYVSYIIKDDGKYNPKFVEEQFNIFINIIKGL